MDVKDYYQDKYQKQQNYATKQNEKTKIDPK